MTVASPLRCPDSASAPLMTRRGWWLVVANLLLPGSAQLLAGNRRLGRVGMLATFLLWALAIVGVVLAATNRGALLGLATSALVLTLAQVLLFAYAVLWVLLTFDTLRLVRLVRARPKARPAIALFSVVLLGVVAGTAAYGGVLAGSARDALGGIFQAGPSAAPVDGRYNIMLLGGDAGPGRDGMRPDSMSVVSVDAKTGKAVMVGLPRNLDPVPFADGSPMKRQYPDGYGAGGRCDVDVCMLNSIYTEVELYKPKLYPDAKEHGSEPGIEAMKDALEGATGLKIQYYVLIDMEGFSDLVDALGGVTIDVKERLPIGGDENGNGVTGWIEPGRQHMDGFTAQWYARSRHTTSDYDRMKRQRKLEDAILAQINPVTVVTKFQGIAAAGGQVVKTDIPQSMLSYFIRVAQKTRTHQVTNLELVPPKIDPENPDYAHIHELVRKTIADSEAQKSR